MVCLGLKIPTVFSDKATIFDENPPARNPTKKLLCCYDHQEIRVWSPSCATYHIHSQPCKHQRSFGELEGFPAYLYRSCIPGAVGHWHRGVAGHGHGTDGGSTGHHIWRWGVDNLRSTWGLCFVCAAAGVAGILLRQLVTTSKYWNLSTQHGNSTSFFLKIEILQERKNWKNSTTGFPGKKNRFWPILEATTCSAPNFNEYFLCKWSFTIQGILRREAFRQFQLKWSVDYNEWICESFETIPMTNPSSQYEITPWKLCFGICSSWNLFISRCLLGSLIKRGRFRAKAPVSMG